MISLNLSSFIIKTHKNHYAYYHTLKLDTKTALGSGKESFYTITH